MTELTELTHILNRAATRDRNVALSTLIVPDSTTESELEEARTLACQQLRELGHPKIAERLAGAALQLGAYRSAKRAQVAVAVCWDGKDRDDFRPVFVLREEA